MKGRMKPNIVCPKHLVISGGGPSLFTILGALKHMYEISYWCIQDILSIYSCSSGAFLGVCICLLKLGVTMDEIETYLVKRCWKTLFTNEVLDFKTAFDTKGLFDENVIKKAITPLFLAAGLSANTTLNDLYNACGIEIVMFAVNINSKPLEKICLSYKSYSELSVYRALTMTMGLPGVVTPTFMDEMCLVDGGLLVNYPYYECVSNLEGDDDDGEKKVLGFKIKWEKKRSPIDSSSNIITFFAYLMKMMAIHIDTSSNTNPEHTNTVECSAPNAGNPSNWIDLFSNSELRNDYVNAGVESAKRYITARTMTTQQTQPECHT